MICLGGGHGMGDSMSPCYLRFSRKVKRQESLWLQRPIHLCQV